MIGVTDDISNYKLVVAPLLYMCKDGFDEKIRKFVKAGGTFLTTYFSGYVEDHDLVITGGYPGRLRDILGIWVEECDAVPVEDIGIRHSFGYQGETYPAEIICDLLHLEGAESLGNYDNDFYAGMPAVTKNHFGEGKAYYVATHSNEAFYRKLFTEIATECGLESIVVTEPETAKGASQFPVEATLRENANGRFLFLLNHGDKATEVTLKKGGHDLLSGKNYGDGAAVELEAKGVVLLKIS